jgi:hypothetical protein
VDKLNMELYRVEDEGMGRFGGSFRVGAKAVLEFRTIYGG